MQRLYLTSSVHGVAHNIASQLDLSHNNKLVFIDTPIETLDNEDISWIIDDKKALIDSGFNVTDYTITGKSKEELEQYLDKFDYIYISGGYAQYFLSKAQQTGFDLVIKDLVLNKRKTYIGTSAGAILAGPQLPEYLIFDDQEAQIKNTKGFGFVNFIIVPHWGDEYFKERYLTQRLAKVYDIKQPPFILLADSQYIEVIDDNFKIISV